MSKRLIPGLIIILLLMAALVSSCSAPVPPQTEEQKPISIGLILPLKGDLQQYGQLSENAINLKVDEVNTKGGVLGRRIEALPGDDTSNGNVAASAAQNFAETQKVAAIVGPYTNQSAIMAAPVANAAETPMVTIRASEANVTKIGNYIFRACFTDTYQGTVLAKFAGSNLQAKKAVVLYNTGDPDSVALTDNFKKEFVKYGGKVDATLTYDNKTTDFTQLVKQAAATNPDVMLLPDFEDKSAAIMKKARALGMKCKFLGTTLWDAQKLQTDAGNAALGSYFTDHFSPDDPDKTTQAFVDLYEGDYGVKPGPTAALSYDAISLVIEAMKQANSADPKKIRDALAKMNKFKGVSGTFTFDEDRNPVKGGVVLKIVEGGQAFEKRIEP